MSQPVLYTNDASASLVSRRAIIHTDLASLSREMRGGLEAYFGRKLPNPAEAEDYTQRVFELILAYPRPILEYENFIRVTAYNLLKDAYREDRSRPRDLSLEQIAWNQDEQEWTGLDYLWDEDPSIDPFERSEFIRAHDEAVRGLFPDLRDAYFLSELRGLTSRESGPLLGVSHTLAATHRNLATDTIRRELSNLQLFSNQGEHARFHNAIREEIAG